MEELAARLVGEYGPLGLGWVLAAWLLLREARLRQQAFDVIVANTRAMAVLAEKIEGRLR